MLKSPFDIIKNNDLWDDFIALKENKIKNFNDNFIEDTKNFKNTIYSVYNIFNDKPKKILIFGKIQSGKTDFMIGLSSLIFSKHNPNIIFCIAQPNSNLLDQTMKRTEEVINQNLYSFNDLKKKSSFPEIKEKVKNNQNIIIFLLKNTHHLEKAINLVKEINDMNVKYFIFDDEGDVTSFNDKNKVEGTTIFNKLKDLSIVSKSNYISITATPYAHFLVEKENYMKPNYVFSLPSSTGYTGIDYFCENWNSTNKGNNFIEIEEIEKEYLDELHLNNDFIKSIETYIIQCYWWTFLERNYTKPRMLINIDKLKYNHEEIKYQVEKIISKINLNKLKVIANQVFPNLNINLNDDDFEKIKKDIELIIFNGNKNKDLNFDKSENYKYQIIIGNKKVERGLTINDLINSFISFRSKAHANADTILQQARFIGYREKYKLMVRVFLTKNLINDYCRINDNINYFLEQISISNNDFKNIENFIPLDNENNFYPTRSSISNFEYESGILLSNDFIINKYEKLDSKLETNSKNFFNKFNSWGEKYLEDKFKHKYIEFHNLINFSKFFFNTTNKEELKSNIALLCIEKQNKTNLTILDQIINLKKYKVIVRLLNENKRKIYRNDFYNYHNLGKGTYASNENEFFLQDNILSIDLIPIKMWKEEDATFSELIYRIRLFIPKNLIYSLQSGYRTIED